MMEIVISDDWQKCQYNEATDTATILREDVDWIKELSANIRKTSSKAIIRDAEHDFHEAMVERYGSKVGGELLMKLWQATKEEE